MTNSLSAIWYQTTFANLLESRTETAAIVGFGVIHIGASLAGISLWQCPILAATGVPCPGCGLTRATMQLLHGDIAASIQTHAFAPIFMIALILMGLVLVLPNSTSQKIISSVRRLEARNGLTAWVLSSLMLYWALRLIA